MGTTQPTEWQDAGVALANPPLQGCQMPKGKASQVSAPGAYLLYNEVHTLLYFSPAATNRYI